MTNWVGDEARVATGDLGVFLRALPVGVKTEIHREGAKVAKKADERAHNPLATRGASAVSSAIRSNFSSVFGLLIPCSLRVLGVLAVKESG